MNSKTERYRAYALTHRTLSDTDVSEGVRARRSFNIYANYIRVVLDLHCYEKIKITNRVDEIIDSNNSKQLKTTNGDSQ